MDEGVRTGVFVKLNQEKLPGCYLHRSHPNDVARVEQCTFICTRSEDMAGPTNNWMESKQAQELAWSMGRLIPNNAQAATPTNNAAIRSILTAIKNPLSHTIYVGFPVSVLAINERYAGEMITGKASTDSVLKMMEQLRVTLRSKITG